MQFENLLEGLRPHAIEIDTLVFMGDSTGVVPVDSQHLMETVDLPDSQITIVHRHGGVVGRKRKTGPLEKGPSGEPSELDLVGIANFGEFTGKFNPKKTCIIFVACPNPIGLLSRAVTSAFAGFVFIFDEGNNRPEEFWRATRVLFDAGYVACAETREGSSTVAAFVRSEAVKDVNAISGHQRGLVAMNTLGTNGRFANQLFQYATLYFYALRHDLEISCPPWEGTRLFGINNSWNKEIVLPQLQFFAFDDDDLALWDIDYPPIDMDLWGYFQETPECWAPHRQLLRKRFALIDELAAPLEAWLNRITENGRRTLVAIHVRRGDYLTLSVQGLLWYRPVPEAWYLSWLEKIWPSLNDPILYVATDSPSEVIPKFGKFGPLSTADVPADTGLAAHELDFEILRRANYTAIANSSFSRMAAILAQDTQVCFRPNFDLSSFVEYQPWIDNQFWARFTDGSQWNKSLGNALPAVRIRSLAVRVELAQTKVRLTYRQDELARVKDQLARVNAALDEQLSLNKEWFVPELSRLETELERVNAALDEQLSVKKEWFEPELLRLKTELVSLEARHDNEYRTMSELIALRDHRVFELARAYDDLNHSYNNLNHSYDKLNNSYDVLNQNSQSAIDQYRGDLDEARRQVANLIFLNSPRGWLRRIVFRIMLVWLKIIDALFGGLSEHFRARCRYLEGLIENRRYREVVNALVKFARPR